MIFEGPLDSTFTPQRTRNLFRGRMEASAGGLYYKTVTNKSDYEHIRDAVASLAPRAFEAVAPERLRTDRLSIPNLKA